MTQRSHEGSRTAAAMRGSGFSGISRSYAFLCGSDAPHLVHGDTRSQEKLEAPIVSVRVFVHHASNTRVDDTHGTVETGLVCGVDLGALRRQPISSGEHEGVKLRVDSSAADLETPAVLVVRRNARVLERVPAVARVVAVRHSGRRSVEASREGATIPRDDRSHRQPGARGVGGPEMRHTHQRLVPAGPTHRRAPRSRWRSSTGAGSSRWSSPGAWQPEPGGPARRCAESRR